MITRFKDATVLAWVGGCARLGEVVPPEDEIGVEGVVEGKVGEGGGDGGSIMVGTSGPG